MSYFSRLTEIVTCNLTQILNEADDPKQAIVQILAEMEEGLAGAQRSVATAAANETRLRQEIDRHRQQVEQWSQKARESLRLGRDDEARQSLLRKREVDDLIAGLNQQQQAALATREHLATMQRALEARLAEARRKQSAIAAGLSLDADHQDVPESIGTRSSGHRHREIDDELEALRRELNAG